MSEAEERILSKTLATVRRHDMLPERGRILLAVSGGPDSLALLHAMKRLGDREFPGLALHAAHLHHGIRGQEADEDLQFVESETARLGVPFSTRRVDVPALAHERGIGLEQAGRDARYGFLLEEARRAGAERIALGHQADDQAETVLMRARRGTGPRGACGIPYVRRACETLVIRPLLDCTRAEIEAFLAEAGLRGRLDATNLCGDYLRNRMRATIIPALRQEWGETFQPDLCALAAAAQRLRAQVQVLCARFAGLAHVAEGRVEIEAERLLPLRDSLFPELLRGWLEEGGLWQRAFGRRDYDALAAMLLPHAERAAVNLPGGLAAVRRGGTLAIQRSGGDVGARYPQRAREDFPAAKLVENGVTDLGCLGRIEARPVEGGMELLSRRSSPLEEFVDRDAITGVMEVRTLRPGDRMRPLGAPGVRKLQDILTDLRVPANKRRTLPLLTAGGRPIWIAGHRIAHEIRLTERTARALHLRFIPPAPPREE